MDLPPVIPETIPYSNLNAMVSEEIEKFNKTANTLIAGLLISLMIPIGFFVVSIFGILYIIKSSKFLNEYPEIKNPMARFPGQSKSDIKRLSRTHLNLKRVIEFEDARKGFWVAAIFPILLLAGLVGAFSYYK